MKQSLINYSSDNLIRPDISNLIATVKASKGKYLKNKIDFRYLNKIDKLENK